MQTIAKIDELQLFAFLANQPQMREWLKARHDKELEVLVNNQDIETLRKAQGKAQLLQEMMNLMDKAPAALKR